VESGPNYIADASIMGGLIDDVLAAKLAVFVNKDTGYFTNKYDNSKFGKQEEVIVRPAFLLRPRPTPKSCCAANTATSMAPTAAWRRRTTRSTAATASISTPRKGL
jgi:hypothetical protein